MEVGASRTRLIMALVCSAQLCAGCFTTPYREVPDFPDRFRDVESIMLIPPLVAVYAMTAGNVEEEVQEWSDAAYGHALSAVRAQVEKMGRRFVPFAGEQGPRPDFRLGVARSERGSRLTKAGESWLLFESAKEAILRHTYDPTQLFPHEMKRFDYTLGAESAALLEGTPADAFLLMIATDHIPTKSRSALIGVGAVAALATGGYAGPGATPAELMAALVESKTGDILWFNRVSMPLSDLRNPEANAALVDLVLKGMNR